MLRFQDFGADEHLFEVNDVKVARGFLAVAVDLAMLGLTRECNAICTILADHGQFDPSQASLELQCVWTYSKSNPPDDIQARGGTVWAPSPEALRQKERAARRRLTHVPRWLDWDSIDADVLEKMMDIAKASDKEEFSDASSGYAAMRLSGEYVAIMCIASDLDHHKVISDIMLLVAHRLQANQQIAYLGIVPRVWRDYLLRGWLQEQLHLSRDAIQKYAGHVLATAKERFERGARRPEDVYPDFSLAQLLDVLNENTVSSIVSGKWRRDQGLEGASTNDGVMNRDPPSVMRTGGTPEKILEAEERLGCHLPADLKTFFTLSDGCDPVQIDEYLYSASLPSLDQIDLEDEDIMTSYLFEIVPGLPRQLNVEWPEILGDAIAIYAKDEDGDGTSVTYVWILGSEDISRSKEKLQIAYDKATSDGKAIIDRYIRYWYGDNDTYKAMTDHCYFETEWGVGAQAVYPNFKSYLARLACRSRHPVKQNVLKMAGHT